MSFVKAVNKVPFLQRWYQANANVLLYKRHPSAKYYMPIYWAGLATVTLGPLYYAARACAGFPPLK